MKIIDISMPIYSGRKMHSPELYPAVTIERVLTPEKEKSFGRIAIKFIGLLHSGTHVDAPMHVMGYEAKSIGDFPLDHFMGEGVLADMKHKVPGGKINGDDFDFVLAFVSLDTFSKFVFGDKLH